jgi:hypothetical protein
MLFRDLRVGDRVRTPAKIEGRVASAPDVNGRVLVRYSSRPDWQPLTDNSTKLRSTAGIYEVTLKEELLVYIGPGG